MAAWVWWGELEGVLEAEQSWDGSRLVEAGADGIDILTARQRQRAVIGAKSVSSSKVSRPAHRGIAGHCCVVTRRESGAAALVGIPRRWIYWAARCRRDWVEEEQAV